MHKFCPYSYLILILFSFFFLLSPQTSFAAVGINKMINFQSKFFNTDGTNVTDGVYSFVFTIYNGAGSAATTLFTESWTTGTLWSSTMSSAPAASGETLVYVTTTNQATLKVGEILTNITKGESVVITSVNTGTQTIGISPTSQAWATTDTVTNEIYVKNGIFKVAIDSLNQNISGVDFNSDTLFLGINFNADGEAKPRIQMAAAPYAMNADKVNGLSFSGTTGNTYTLPSTNNGTIITSNAPTQTITSTQTSGTLVALSDATAQTAAETGLSVSLSGTGAFDQTGLSFNLSGATGTNLNDILGTGSTWKVSKTGAITGATLSLTPGSNTAGLTITGSNVTTANLLNLSANNTSGTLVNQSYGSASVLSGAVIGHTIDLATNVTSTNQNETGLNVLLDNPTNTNITGTQLLKGIVITAAGTITQNGLGGNTTYSGVDTTIPALTLTTGTALIGNGISVTGGNITQTSGTLTENGILIDQSATTITTGGTLNGLKILAPTASQSAGTVNSIYLGTSTSAPPNTGDMATISVGNIASTAQQNRSTLNLQNGGTGYFDLELVRGMINFQQTNYFDEEFIGKTLDTTNRMTSTATGTTGLSCGIATGVVNGVYRMTTGTIANNRCDLSTLATLSNGFYQRGNNPVYEANVKVSSATNGGQRMAFGFTAAVLGASNTLTTAHAYILKRSTDTTWQCSTSDGVTESVTSIGGTIDTSAYHRMRVVMQNGTIPQVVCSVDGTSVSKTTNIPGATTAMDIYAKGETVDTTTENIDVDYIRSWQDDPADGMAVVAQESDTQPPPTLPTNIAATVSGELRVKGNGLIEGLLTVIDSLKATNFIVTGISDFFNSTIFHKSVTFVDKPLFNNDTGGTAVVKKGDASVEIRFSSDFEQLPVVNATLIDNSPDAKPEESLLQNYSYKVAKRSTHGFFIQLNKPANDDLTFSWIALNIKDANTSESNEKNALFPTIFPTLFVTPSVFESSPTPTPKITP
jgi:hypothetical protein